MQILGFSDLEFTPQRTQRENTGMGIQVLFLSLNLNLSLDFAFFLPYSSTDSKDLKQIGDIVKKNIGVFSEQALLGERPPKRGCRKDAGSPTCF